MNERREKRERWVQRGEYDVELEVGVLYPDDDPSQACLEPATIRWLDEVARKAADGDVEYLQKVGRVFKRSHIKQASGAWHRCRRACRSRLPHDR